MQLFWEILLKFASNICVMMSVIIKGADDDTRDEKLTVNFQLDRLGHRLRTKAIVGKASVHSALVRKNQF